MASDSVASQDWRRIKAWEASLPPVSEEEMKATASAMTSYLAQTQASSEEDRVEE